MKEISKGSVKQIEWANSIKSEKHINAAADALIARANGSEEAIQAVESARQWLLGCEDSRFFIDNRFYLDCNSANYVDKAANSALELYSNAFEAMNK